MKALKSIRTNVGIAESIEFKQEPGMSLTELQPSRLWDWFARICQIPHPTKAEFALQKYIHEWAKRSGLEVHEDQAGNLLLRKCSTSGYQDRKCIVLQAHLDMVPQKNADSSHNFDSDPIMPIVEGDWVRANGTTLGADNGIGVAAIMSILSSSSISHGPLEVLLTVGEETGMRGARALQPGWLQGKILLNTDSEEEGTLFIGCVGASGASIKFRIETEDVSKDSACYRILVTGLKGGHSGLDIHHVHGNAIKILASVLQESESRCGVRLSSLSGGTMRNAIPRDAEAMVVVNKNMEKDFTGFVNAAEKCLQADLHNSEPNFHILSEKSELPQFVYQRALQEHIFRALNQGPNGVINMSEDYPETVETSCNIGVIRQKKRALEIKCLGRSLKDAGLRKLEENIRLVYGSAGANVKFSDSISAWTPDKNSKILNVAKASHYELFGEKANVAVLHAGLECGVIKSVYPEIDIVSYGPTILNAHSPAEKVNISSVDRFWKMTLEILRNSPLSTSTSLQRQG